MQGRGLEGYEVQGWGEQEGLLAGEVGPLQAQSLRGAL